MPLFFVSGVSVCAHRRVICATDDLCVCCARGIARRGKNAARGRQARGRAGFADGRGRRSCGRGNRERRDRDGSGPDARRSRRRPASVRLAAPVASPIGNVRSDLAPKPRLMLEELSANKVIRVSGRDDPFAATVGSDPKVYSLAAAVTDRGCGLVGGGGHARMVAETLQRRGIKVEAVFERPGGQPHAAFAALRIRYDDEQRAVIEQLPLHLAVGVNAVRERLARALVGALWQRAVDPSALFAASTVIDDGVFIGMGAMVQSGVRLGRHAIVNTGVIVEHDAIIGDFVHLAPGSRVLGEVKVGHGALIGAGAVILPGLTIGARATVGAGALVTRDVADGQTVVGNPARQQAVS